MATFTPAQLQAQLTALANNMPAAIGRTTADVVGQIQRDVLASAQTAVHRTPHPRASWVTAESSATGDGGRGEVRLRGGMAHLAERGSYRKPGGWIIRGRGRGWRGPFHHPAIAAQPFWSQPVDQNVEHAPAVYFATVEDELRRLF